MNTRNLRTGFTAGLSFISTVLTAAAVSAAPITSDWTPGNVGDWASASDAANWTHSSVPASTTFPTNTGGDNFTVNIGGASSSSVALNVSVTIDSLNVAATNSLDLNNAAILTINNNGSVTNDGTIGLNSTGSATQLLLVGNNTIGGSGTIVLSDNPANAIRNNAASDTLTHAAGHTIRGSGNVGGNLGAFDNAGTIVADQATTLIVDPGTTLTNTGVLRAEGGATLQLNGGTYNNAGGLIVADGAGSNVNVATNAVTVNGGTLTTLNGGEIVSGNSIGGTFAGVTITAGSTVRQNNSDGFQVTGGIVNDGTWNLDATVSSTILRFIGTQTIGGSGEFVMGDDNNNLIVANSNSDILTLDTNQTIRGAGSLLTNNGGIVNDGAIRQQGTTELRIDPGSPNVDGFGANFVNNGVLRSEGTGGMTLVNAVYQNNSTIETVGGGDIRLNSATEIRGGNLSASGGGVIDSAGSSIGPLLSGVTITSGTSVVQSNGEGLRIIGGVNNGTIQLDGSVSATTVTYIGLQTLTGTGEILMSDSSNNQIRTNSNSDVLTLDTNQTIRGAGRLLVNNGGFVNNGTILQQGTEALLVDPGTANADGFGNHFVNNGVLRAEGTGGLTLNAANYQNNTLIESVGGGDIRLTSSATSITGGTISVSGGGVVDAQAASIGAFLQGVTISAGTTVQQSNGEGMRYLNIVNDGTLELNATVSSTNVQFIGTQTIDGTGEIVMSDSTNNAVIVNSNSDILTLGANQTIRGAGRILANVGGFINDGTILQQGASTMTLDPGTPNVDGNGAHFENNAVIRSEGTGGLILNAGIYQNNATIESVGGGDIRLVSTATEIRDGVLSVTGGGVVDVQAGSFGSLLRNVTVGAGTTAEMTNGEGLRIVDGITNDGTISLDATVSATNLTAVGTQTIGGSGEIVMSDSAQNRIFANSNSDVITLGANQTIRGAGNILVNNGGFINQGTILADQSVNEIVLNAGPNPTGFRNEGTMRATGAAGFNIVAGPDFTQAAGILDIQAASRVDVTSGNYLQTGGETRVDGEMLITGTNVGLDLQGGRLSGTGLVDFDGLGVHVLSNTGGTLAAGNSPGILTVQDGTYVQSSGGAFEFELNGFTPGVGHDLLTIVNGDADLGGNLDVIADQLFASTLSIGDQFEVVRLDSSGSFLDGDSDTFADLFDLITVDLAGLAFSQFFDTNVIGGTSLFLQVVQADVPPPGGGPIPEPAPLLVLIAGLAGLVWMRRRAAA